MPDDKDIHVYTVSELTRDIRFVLEDAFPKVWVEGEASNFKTYSSGHMYFSIKDESSVLKCVMFRNVGASLKFKIEDGMHLLCSGRVNVYDKRGEYQLYVSAVEPRGKGALQAAFEQLKAKLYKEGLFDEARKKPLPFLPARIGVITSPTGAAIRDILNVVRRRFANIEVTIRPVRVQGDKAGDEIVRALGELSEYNRYITETGAEDHPIDVIILGRGGGSLEDLWSFNEEKVARAIYASEIPVISAVGHEIDYTISDFTADFRAPTPSAAAELVIPVKEELQGRIKDYVGRIYTAVKLKVGLAEKEVSNLRSNYVLRAPMNVILQLRQQVDDFIRNAVISVKHTLELKRQNLGMVAGKLDTLSPLSVLDRGYSITFKDDRIVKNVASIKKGDVLNTRFSKGAAKSRVERICDERNDIRESSGKT